MTSSARLAGAPLNPKETNMIDLMSPLPQYAGLNQDPFPTSEEAKMAGAHGWNLCCQRCGRWGAAWYYCRPTHPEWGDMAMCAPHAKALRNEVRRHQAAVKELTSRNFRSTGQETTR